MNRVLQAAREHPERRGEEPLVDRWTVNVGPEGDPEQRRAEIS
jgi:hypothetical protein